MIAGDAAPPVLGVPIGRREGRPIRAGIFDLDGVLLDSEPLHHRAINEILHGDAHGSLSVEAYRRYLGTTDEYTWRDLVRRYDLPKPASYYSDRFDSLIVEYYRQFSEIAPGARELLEALKARGLPLAVASSSRIRWVVTCLAALGVRGYFDALVCGNMVRRSKPDPEIYLLAARRLGVPPAECFAVEDSPKGVASAVTAGMLTVAVDTPNTSGLHTGAQIHVRSLRDLDCALLGLEAPVLP
jgi:HAD superfamily hydrolase (TIGR01509 family)